MPDAQAALTHCVACVMEATSYTVVVGRYIRKSKVHFWGAEFVDERAEPTRLHPVGLVLDNKQI